MSPTLNYARARITFTDSVALTVLCAASSLPYSPFPSGPLAPPTHHERQHASTNRAFIRSERLSRFVPRGSHHSPYNAQNPYDPRAL